MFASQYTRYTIRHTLTPYYDTRRQVWRIYTASYDLNAQVWRYTWQAVTFSQLSQAIAWIQRFRDDDAPIEEPLAQKGESR